MNKAFGRKAALSALLLVIAFVCVLFAYACDREPVTINFTLEGEILPGTQLNAMAFITGGERELTAYADAVCVYEVIEGKEIATAEGGKITIAQSAAEGDVFKVALIYKDLRLEKEYTVAASEVATVQILCDNNAEAGATLPLSVRIYPEGASSREPTYTVVSGEATIEGNLLKIDANADQGDVVVRATLEGVESPKKTVHITTVQTRSVYWAALEAETVLPGGSLLCRAEKYPENSSFDLTVTLEKGAELAEYEAGTGILRIKDDAPIPSEVVLLARSGSKEERLTVRVAHPDVRAIYARGGGSVAPGAERTFAYSVEPIDADPASVTISVVEGGDAVEWSGGATFRVSSDAAQGAEITFQLESGEAYTTITFTVERRTLSSLTIDTTGSTDYLRSGEMLTFTHTTVPADYDGIVNYRALEGADLVTIDGETVTVKEGVGIGTVRIVAESADGTVSNEVEISISGRYTRRVYSNWSNVSLSGSGGASSIWMVLPNSLNAGIITVIVPYEVVDLVIEGRYDGTDETAYRDLYFYFRNTAERTVTLRNFGTIATQGLGGTVMDLGSSGSTEILLEGVNLIRADSPYMIDNNGETRDGAWNVGSYASYESLTLLRRSGKYGYRGAAGGTALSGYSLTFGGTGRLTAEAGNGVNGTPGGKGADAQYGTDYATYVSGAGGDGGHGGDSGVAIHAYSVRFTGGFVTAVSGNAGMGASGGAAGSLDALAGRDVVAISGGAGKDGKNGVLYPAVYATVITGDKYTSSQGRVESRDETYSGTLADVTDRLSSYYGVNLHYGNDLYNPYANKSKAYRYTMEVQLNATALMQQTQFLMYTMSVMPKNCWQEVAFLSGKAVSIYLCKSIKSGSGGTILGLTSETNNVWFATFDTEIRGVYYGGYYNIMLHEFTHVFHYNCSASARRNFEDSLRGNNYVKYKSAYGDKDYVYGVEAGYDENNSCFLSAYSRKNVMEDTAETVSIVATFLSLEPPLKSGTAIRTKFDLLVRAFGREFETLSVFKTGETLFCYPHLFD